MKDILKKIIFFLLPFLRGYFNFCYSITNRVTLKDYLRFKIQRKKMIYWPVHKNSEITHPKNIFVGINSNPGTRPGCYIQGNGGIYIGNYVHFASNIGIISANHDLYNQKQHIEKEVVIGDYSWIGMNVVILPGTTLGPRTVVGAGSVVTQSFPNGYCVIAGNPARCIKLLEKDKYLKTQFKSEYFGFIPKEKFKQFASKYLTSNKYYNKIMSETNS